VIEVLDLKKGRSLCIGDSLIPLYEVSLLSFEKQVSSCLEREKIYLLHAASLGKDGKGILFPATNSFGKTNLTITLLQFGFNLLSDDKVFIDAGKNRALYYPRRLRVNRNSIKRLKGLDFLLKRDPSGFLGSEERWLIDTDENNSGFDISILPEVELCMILFPTIWINDASKIIPSEPRRSLPRLLQSFEWPMNFEKRKIAFQLITGIKCFELLMGSKPEELGRLMVDLWEREMRS
jgi:hypothetical protein